MADEQTESEKNEKGGAGNASPDINLRPQMGVCVPIEEICYMISEDRLNIIYAGGKDTAFDFAVGFFFGALGFLQNLFAAYCNIRDGKAVTAWDAIASIIAIACLAAAVAKYSQHKKTKTDVDALMTRIRTENRKIILK